jgi:hypothetical protein
MLESSPSAWATENGIRMAHVTMTNVFIGESFHSIYICKLPFSRESSIILAVPVISGIFAGVFFYDE